MFLMARRNHPSEAFRRSVRDAQGNVTHVLEFPKGNPVEVSGDDLKAVAGDIGKALVAVTVTDRSQPEDGKPPQLPLIQELDAEATAAALADELAPAKKPQPTPAKKADPAAAPSKKSDATPEATPAPAPPAADAAKK